jgi:hypothetical protein
MSLLDIYNEMVADDENMGKEAEEKLAEEQEEEAAARIMGRAFMDEVQKLAQGFDIPKMKAPPSAPIGQGRKATAPGWQPTGKLPEGGVGAKGELPGKVGQPIKPPKM